MTTIKSILRLLGAPVRKEASREVENELRFHIEMRTRDNIAAGMSPEDAEADAMRRFGDFESIQADCEEIRKERLTGSMKVMKGVIWTMIGCGLTLKLATDVVALHDVGQFLILIAVLWRLLIYLREMQPDQHRIKAAEQPALSIIQTVSDFSLSGFTQPLHNPVPTYDEDGRTPVERLISDKIPDKTVR